MSIIVKITRGIPVGSLIKTPSGRSQFEVYHIDPDRVMIRVGKRGYILTIPASCFEGVPDFLRGKGWIRIGAIHNAALEGTFDEYVQRSTHGTSAASYVAPILERIGIIEIDRKRPARIRLKMFNSHIH